MRPILFFIGSCCLAVSALAQPKPVPSAVTPSAVVTTFKSPATRLNTTGFVADLPTTVASRVEWTSDLEADKTVGAPTFLVRACITAAKPVSRYELTLNRQLVAPTRELKVEQDPTCTNVFSQSVELIEGENRLQLIAYLTGGGEVTAPLVVTYKKPPVAVLEKRLALVVGNADYPGANKLGNPVNDANDMAASLKSLGFDVILYTNLNNRAMREAVKTFGDKLRDYQVGLFYYAGHGVQSKGRNYLVPLDAKYESENEIEYDCLLADRILTKMEDARTRTNIVVLDACRNAPFERSWSRGGGGDGLATMDAPIGSVIAYATAPGKTAADGNGRNGLYTAALLKALKLPNQTIIQLFQQVRADVLKQSNNKQLPWESTSLTSDFYFQRK